ncbi:MAG: electron transfer flavoprotein-ubiquinone oxidoreductase [Gammaproteobacteria bacterium]|nr:MAG: electron transfer flavoprotein-ubiquinone oxidoreductase [Gammaproteobacteria bacterium]
MSRELVEYDVLVVGGGPAGLATAIRLRQLASARQMDLSVCLIEKGSEIGAHILSGAVMEPRAIAELFPDWKERGGPVNAPVIRDEIYYLTGPESALTTPGILVPPSMHNQGNYVISLGNMCRWLAGQAEACGVDIFPGFAANEVLFKENGSVAGIATGDMGIDVAGNEKETYTPGMELRAKYTVFAEGCRGHLGRQLIDNFNLARDADPQHYSIGLKELWDVKPGVHEQGLVVHGVGWPIGAGVTHGFFLYHLENNQVVVGLSVNLDYSNPYLSPFSEFQRLKHHPLIARVLKDGRRVSYGARAIAKGGVNSLPRMSMPGALLAGCEAGTLNFAKIKGTHTAIKSGMIAAETLFEALTNGDPGGNDLIGYANNIRESWLYDELYRVRNYGPALHKFGLLMGSAFNYLDQVFFKGKLPYTLHDKNQDHAALKPASDCRKLEYPKPDGILSFDRLSSVFISNTNHEEDQPCHLTLKNKDVPITINLEKFGYPEQYYCPAGVYELVEQEGRQSYQINAQNCVHCKTCDIKDPTQNIMWICPEGGGGPNYPNM